MILYRSVFCFVAILASTICQDAANAQLGQLFSGTKIETVDTKTIAKMLREQREAREAAEKAGEEPPTPSFVLVDVRSEEEVKVSVIPGAITKAQYERDQAKYKDIEVIPYCTVGGRSGAYAKKLAKEGVKVKNYKGSILKWVDAELPLVTLDGKPTNRVHTYSDRYKVPSKYEQVTK